MRAAVYFSRHLPVYALTQARSLAKIEAMARDLIATILDAAEADFEVETDYTLAASVSDLVNQAKGARAWLEAAQDLWQERSAAAARELAASGYSLRETAVLLGLSHQRVDQLLGSGAQREKSPFERLYYGPSTASHSMSPDTAQLSSPVAVVLSSAFHGDLDGHFQRSELVQVLGAQLENRTSGPRTGPHASRGREASSA